MSLVMVVSPLSCTEYPRPTVVSVEALNVPLNIMLPVELALSSWRVNVATPDTAPDTVVVPVRDINVKTLLPPVIEDIFMAAPVALPPLFELSTVEDPVRVIAPRSICWPAVLTVPPILVPPAQAVVERPPVKVRVSPPLPKVTLPVFRKLVSLVMVPPAFKAISYPWAAVVKVPRVTAPLKIISCPSVVSVRVSVVALTVEENVVPFELVIVRPVRVVEPPTAPPNVIEPPEPAFNPKV